jgi:hypothetical protein
MGGVSRHSIDSRLVNAIEVADLSIQHLHIAVRAARQLVVMRYHYYRRTFAVDIFQHIDHLPRHE